MSPAVALALHVAALLLAGASISCAIRWRRRSKLADRIIRAQQRTRLQRQMHLRRDHLGPDDDWAHRLLNDIQALPTTTRERGNQ
ncbi:hypothetical protein [Streptomyces violaceusniger]|uniref:hypothetical protein n=1 Tax=Streptomyces violaceusniger TaxID=68280 RepID=UPI0036B51889